MDEFTGGAGNDTFTATESTLSPLDALDGGDGTDLLRISDTIAPDASGSGDVDVDFSLADIKNIETITLRSVDVISGSGSSPIDTTDIAGLETFNVTKATGVYLKAADTADVNVSGVTGEISVSGGKDVTVNDATADNSITVGNEAAGGDAAGAITITDTDNAGTAGTDDITVEGGTDVTVTATADKASGKIVVGHATNGMATGTVNVTQNLESDGETALDNSSGGIAVTGGTSITINSNATSDAKDENSDQVITMHDISATGSEDTTEVTVTQTKTINTVNTPVEDEVKATHTVTFKALNAGQTTTLNGLTFTASTNLTAADVAQAFANLTVDDTQSETGPTANGFYSGAFDNVPGWTSGAADGAKVVFTAPTSDTTTKMVADGTVLPDVSAAIVAGSAAVAKDESANDIIYGDVAVDDHAGTADATITTVTLDGFDYAELGGTNSLGALTTLSLANGKSAVLNTTQSALDLTVNNISSDLDLDGNSGAINITDLNITTVGADSTIIFTATAVTDLTIDAAVDLDTTGSAFDALENVTIAGAGAVILDGTIDDTLATIDAANNEGGVTATVKGNVVVTGGDGDDEIEVNNDTIAKAINLGAGDDTLTLFAGTTAGKISATVDGGIGSDTLSISSADAAANSTDTDFDNAVTGFEMLYINDAAGTTETTTDTVTTTTINLANLAYSNVITSGTNIGSARDVLVLDNLANNGMVVLNGDGDIEVNVADAADGTADSLNLVGNAAKGSVTANNVETINIDAVAGESKFALTADSVETISITGFEFVNLTSATDYTSAALGDTSTITSGTLTMIDASAMTDGGIVAATSLAEQTIKGGAGTDYLTAAHSKAVIEGGDGADTIFVTDGATSAVIDGGAGADTFDITGAALGVEAFATFNNVDAGDKFLLNASSFSSDEVAMTLDDPSTSDYINAAFNQTDGTAGEAIWFQHNNNTYIVDNQGLAGFDAADVVVKLTGLVDLSAASFNASGILEIA